MNEAKTVITFFPRVNPDTVTTEFTTDGEPKCQVCWTREELSTLLATSNCSGWVSDIGRQVRVRGWDMTVVRLDDSSKQYHQSETWIFNLDMRQFLKACLEIWMANESRTRAELAAGKDQWDVKKIESSCDIARFQRRQVTDKPVGAVDVAKTAKDKWQRAELLKSMLSFRRALKPTEQERFMRQLSHYLPVARFFGSGPEEIDFNGRFPGGCGFNGGIILRGDEYSTHT